MSQKVKKNYQRRLSILFNRMVMPSPSLDSNGLNTYWKCRWFESLSISLLLLSTLVFIYAARRFVLKADINQLVVASVLYIGLLFFTIVKSLSYKVRIIGSFFVLYAVAFLLIFKAYDLVGVGLLISLSVVANILIGVGVSYFLVGFNVISCVFLDISRQYFLGVDNMVNHINWELYMVALVVNIAILMPISVLVKGITYTHSKEERLRSIIIQHQHQIYKAKEQAQQSDSLKTAFLSNMSHEIRTPMNAILGFSNLLSHRDIAKSEKKEFVNLIRLNGKNLLTLVEDLIDISKIDSGQLQIKNRPTYLHDVMMQVYNSYIEDLSNRGLTQQIKLYLKEGIADSDVMLLTDGTRLKQILLHIVGNAIKFTERGYVEFGYEVKDENFLEFYVKDTGIGVREDKKEFVFERFSKVTDLSPKLYGGTGIGLSLSKDLVTLMGGEIWLESEQNVGSTFYFTIPFQQWSEKEKVQERTFHKPLIYNWEGKTILIAEDEEDNFRYLEVALSISNASLIWARNGQEAVDIVKRIPSIDLVLMDIKMPLMNGYDATRKIKSINPNIPVIAQTAYAMSEEREKSIIVGCDDYIAKPINYEDLLNTVSRYMPSIEVEGELMSV